MYEEVTEQGAADRPGHEAHGEGAEGGNLRGEMRNIVREEKLREDQRRGGTVYDARRLYDNQRHFRVESSEIVSIAGNHDLFSPSRANDDMRIDDIAGPAPGQQ
jgi:hypothetical protein